MDDLLREFLTETSENIAVLDVELVRLEQNPNDPKLLSSIFRLVHTIKGTCGFLGLPRLEKVAHASENILGKFRDQVFPVTPPAVSLILESLDRIKMLLAELEASETDMVEILANDHPIARGQIVVTGNRISVEVTELIRKADALREPGLSIGDGAMPLFEAAPEPL